MSDDNEIENRTIIIEAPSGERFEADVPCGTQLSKVAADFYDSQQWPTKDRSGRRQRAVVELVNPDNEDETKRLNGDMDICAAGVENGDTLRIFSESIAGVDERARQRTLITDHRKLETLCERMPQISFEANRTFAPDLYKITINFLSFTELPPEQQKPTIGETHQLEIILGADYPRRAPFVRWLTPIFHPNIHPQNGAVCLGVLGERYLPSMGLARLVRMLTEMVQWRNFDASNAFNTTAARWAADPQHWKHVEAIGGYPYQAQESVDNLLKALKNAGQPRITFRPLSATTSSGGEA